MVLGSFLYLRCSGDGGSDAPTSVDPSNLEELTNGFTEGNTDISQDAVDGFMKAFPYMFYSVEQYDALLGGNFKTGFGILSGRELSPFSAVLFALMRAQDTQKNPKITGSEINSLYPSCMSISGLPTALEEYLKGESSFSESLRTVITNFLSEFTINVIFDGRCVVKEYNEETFESGIAYEGTFTIEGGVEMDANSFAISQKITYSDASSILVGQTEDMTINIEGSIGMEASGLLKDTVYKADFTMTATAFRATTTLMSPEIKNMVFSMDGVIFGKISALAVPLSYYGNEPNLQNMLGLWAFALSGLYSGTYKFPDICSATYYIVFDITVAAGDDNEATLEGTEMDLLWGTKLKLSHSGENKVCGNELSFDTKKFVFFKALKEFFVADLNDAYFHGINLYGSAGNEIFINADDDGESCSIEAVEVPEGTGDLTCSTWTADYVDGLRTWLLLNAFTQWPLF